MQTTLRNVKGTSDYLPEEQTARRAIARTLEDVFERYGYQPLETPIVCHYDVLAAKYAGGAEILKEVYKLTDQGQRELALRYDLTIPFARVVGMNPQLRMPFKRYEIGKVFRDGPVKAGRNREFIQCDVDVVGVGTLLAEIELLSLTAAAFDRLGLPICITYNNRKLLAGLVQAAGLPMDLAGEVILSLDKIAKIGREAVTDEIAGKGVSRESIETLLEYLDIPPEELLEQLDKKAVNALMKEGVTELLELQSCISAAGLEVVTKFSPWLARGLEIYTGTVWEVFLADGTIASSIGAGGRYDKIIGAFLDNGADYPAVGMSFGLDVIYEALRLKGRITPRTPADVYLIPLGTDREILGLASRLRALGMRVETEMSGRKLKKVLDYVNKAGVPYVVIVGPDELCRQTVKLRDMAEGKEEELSWDDLMARLQTSLANSRLTDTVY